MALLITYTSYAVASTKVFFACGSMVALFLLLVFSLSERKNEQR
jgi:hypothetical protein